ncbi:hypothetical protein GOODEAATRI_004233 [Goodea atripinnis]|uniref:Uncharacterized protein n=1 Tax=Goodea atripinnis TaxID=208336 RepID=A0ABV0N011_9TELE
MNKSLGRNPTIKISRATRVSEQWDASLDRVITNANEMRNLDEFLGNQVSKNQREVDSSLNLFNQICGKRDFCEVQLLILLLSQVNDFRSRGKSLSPTESIFVTATMQFREHIKSMYSLPNPTIGYKALMTGFKNKVIHLATDKQQEDVQLVVNLFQSVLDGFIRGEVKKEEAEPAKVKLRFRAIIGLNMKTK